MENEDIKKRIGEVSEMSSRADKQIGALLFVNNLLEILWSGTRILTNKEEEKFQKIIDEAQEKTDKMIGYKPISQ